MTIGLRDDTRTDEYRHCTNGFAMTDGHRHCANDFAMNDGHRHCANDCNE